MQGFHGKRHLIQDKIIVCAVVKNHPGALFYSRLPICHRKWPGAWLVPRMQCPFAGAVQIPYIPKKTRSGTTLPGDYGRVGLRRCIGGISPCRRIVYPKTGTRLITRSGRRNLAAQPGGRGVGHLSAVNHDRPGGSSGDKFTLKL